MRPLVWGGLELGCSLDEVKAKLPSARSTSGGLILDVSQFGGEFEVQFEFKNDQLARVTLSFIRTLGSNFSSIREQLIDSVCWNHGRGSRKVVEGTTLEKKWVDGAVAVNLFSLEDDAMPVLSVEYTSFRSVPFDPWRYKS